MRNALVVMDADAVIAFPGAYGTLTEIAFALLANTKVVGLGTWALGEGISILSGETPADVVRLALD
jgi:predicted Rossmann-fold nucleotide-binding protein